MGRGETVLTGWGGRGHGGGRAPGERPCPPRFMRLLPLLVRLVTYIMVGLLGGKRLVCCPKRHVSQPIAKTLPRAHMPRNRLLTCGRGTSHLPAFSFRFCLMVLLRTLARSTCKSQTGRGSTRIQRAIPQIP